MLLVTEASSSVALLYFKNNFPSFIEIPSTCRVDGFLPRTSTRRRTRAHVREGGGKPAHSDVFLKSLTGRTAQFKAARRSRQHAVLLNVHQK